MLAFFLLCVGTPIGIMSLLKNNNIPRLGTHLFHASWHLGRCSYPSDIETFSQSVNESVS